MTAGSVIAASLAGAGLSGLAFAVAVRTFSRRGAGSRWAWTLFGVFWSGIGAYLAVDAGWALALATVGASLPLAVTVLHLKVLAAIVAFAGLVSYLLCIYTGRDRVIPYVLASYALLYLVVVFYYEWRAPIGQHLGDWGAALDYANEGGAFGKVVVVFLFVPPGVSALAYALLLRHDLDRATKRRVAWASTSLVALFAGLTLGWLNGAWPWWGLAEKLLGAGALVGMLWSLRGSSALAVTTR